MAANITITGLPLAGTVTDTTYLATELANVTQRVTGLSLKNYMSNLANLTVTGNITGNLNTASQPYITSLGNLTVLNTAGNIVTYGQIISNIASGTAPLVITSNTFVANLYVARALTSDNATGAITNTTAFSNVATSDAFVSGNIGNITVTLRTVNSTAGTWGGLSGSTYFVPQITINSKGLITVASNNTLNLSSAAVTSLTANVGQITANSSVGGVLLSLPAIVSVNAINATSLSTATVTATGAISGVGLFDNTYRVVANVLPTSGAGITISGLTTTGPNVAFIVTNSGVVSVTSGSGIGVNANTGAITITNLGVTGLSGNSTGISVSSTTGGVTVFPTNGFNGYGARTVSTATPSGGADGDIWYQVAS